MNSKPLFLTCLLVGLAAARLMAADPLLTVTLASGREFTAHVDARTDGERLWLRFPSGNGSLLRPVAWSRIKGARVGGKTIDMEDLQQTVENLKSSASVVAEAVGAAAAPSPPESCAAFIQVRAWVANWDGDVEPDGICLLLEVFDDDGRSIPASGTAEAELFVARQRKFHEAPQSRGWSTDLIERWAEEFQLQDFAAQGTLVKLPFGAIHPDFSPGLDGHGLLHVRVVIPGSGVFEQSIDGLRLQPFSPVRQYLQSQSGRRYLSAEGTGRN